MADIIATQLEAKNIGGSSAAIDNDNQCVTKSKAINSFNCDVINADTYSDNQLVCKKDLKNKVVSNITVEYYNTSNKLLFSQTVSPIGFTLPTITEILTILRSINDTSVCNAEIFKWLDNSDETALSFFVFVQYKDKSIYDINGSNVYYTSGDTPSNIQSGTQKYIVTIQPYIEISVSSLYNFKTMSYVYGLYYYPELESSNIGHIDLEMSANLYSEQDAFITITVKKNDVIKNNNNTYITSGISSFDIRANTYTTSGIDYTPNANYYLALGNLNQNPASINYNNCAASEYNPLGTSGVGCQAIFDSITATQVSVTWRIRDYNMDRINRYLSFSVTVYK